MTPFSINTIIFDLGGVLIDWNPVYLYSQIIPDEKERQHFFDNICTSDWNEDQDAGRSLQEATDLLVKLHPTYASHIQAFYGRWEEMLGGAIEGTVKILSEIKALNTYKLYALTNWSDETFPVAVRRFEFLQWFEGILVSGREKTRKPFPVIYHLLFERFSINPVNALFIDDNLRNIEAAKKCGLQVIHFQSSQQLREELIKLGIVS